MVRRTTTVKTQATQTQSEIDASIARANALELEYELNVLNREQSRSSKYGVSGGGIGDSQSGIIDGLYWTTTGGTTTGTSFADGDSISRPRTQATGTIGDYDEDIYSGYSVNLPECIVPTLIDQSPSLDYLTLSPRATRKIVSTFNYAGDESGGKVGKKFIKISSSNRHPLGQCRQLIALQHQQQSHLMSTSHHRQLRPSTAAPETGQEVENEQVDTTQTLGAIDQANYTDTVTLDEPLERRKQVLMKDELKAGPVASSMSHGHSSKMDGHLLDQTGYSELDQQSTQQGNVRSKVARSIDQTENLEARGDRAEQHESSSGHHQLDHSLTHLPTGTMTKKTRKLARSAKSIKSIDSSSPPSSACQSLPPSSSVAITSHPLLDSTNLPAASTRTSGDASASVHSARKEGGKGRNVQSRPSRHVTPPAHYTSPGQLAKDKEHRRTRAVSADDLERGVDSSTSSDSDGPVPVVTNLPLECPGDRRHSLSTLPTVTNLPIDDDQLFTFSRPIKLPSPSSSTATLKRSSGKLNTSGQSELASTSSEVIPTLPLPAREKLLLSGKVKLPSETVPVRKVTSTVSSDRSKELATSRSRDFDVEDDEDEYEDETEKVTTTTTTTTTATMTGDLSGVSITSPDSDTGHPFVATTATVTTATTTTVTSVTVSAVGQRGSVGSSSNYVTATEASLDRGSGTIDTATSVNTPFETVSSCTASYYSSPSSGVGKVEATTSPGGSRKSSQESFWSTGQQTPGQGRVGEESSDSDVTGTAQVSWC